MTKKKQAVLPQNMPQTNMPSSERQGLSPVVQYTLVVMALLALALFLWQIVGALLLAFAGVLIAVFLRGCASRLSAYTPLSTPWALSVVRLVILSVLGTFVWLVGPQVATQFDELTQTLPHAFEQLKQYLQRYAWGQYILQHMTAPTGGVSLGVNVFTRVTGFASTVLTTLADLLLILFTGVFFAVNPDVYLRGLILLIPQRQATRVRAALDSTGPALWHWLMGRLLAMLFVGVFVTVGLLLLGVPLALVLGLIAGLLDFVSFVGPIVAAVPGMLLALTLGPTQALYAILVYVLAQLIEGFLVTPLIQQHAVALPPSLVILAVAAFGVLLGLPGVILATPLTVVGMVLVHRLYVEDILGKKG